MSLIRLPIERFGANFLRKVDGKIKGAKELENRFRFLGGQARLINGKAQGRGYAETYGLSVEIAAVARGVFYGMADGVAEV